MDTLQTHIRLIAQKKTKKQRHSQDTAKPITTQHRYKGLRGKQCVGALCGRWVGKGEAGSW